MQPAATNAPTAVNINLSTKLDWNRTRAEHVDMPLGASPTVSAYERTHDPLWDGPYAQPATATDWRTSQPADADERLQSATAALQDAVTGLDLLQATPWDHADPARSYATIHVSFAQRPTGIDHLRPFEDHTGRWTVALHTSLDDLFTDPVLAPIVDAARSVLAAARPAVTTR